MTSLVSVRYAGWMRVPEDRPSAPDYSLERDGPHPVCGIDEVGRGAWAGPVLAAAVILDPAAIPEGLNDSKLLPAPRRAELAAELERAPPSSASVSPPSPRSRR